MQAPHRSFFANSGAEAIEAAIKLARYYTRRPALIAFFGAFHGRTMGALSLTAARPMQRAGSARSVPGVYHVPYRELLSLSGRPTPETCAAECLRFIEDQLFVHLVVARRRRGDLRRADPGRGRLRRAAGRVSQRLRELATTHGMLLVVDEVQSGMGRTGKMFAIEHTGVHPDIVTMAKGIASGLPLGVATARSEVMSWPPGAHASTFGGNPVSCAASLATIELLRDGLMKNADTVGAHMMAGARALMEKHPDHRRRARSRVDDRRWSSCAIVRPRNAPRRSAMPSSATASRAACSSSVRGRTPSACRRRWC